MARKSYKPEEIISLLRQIEALQPQGMAVSDAVRQLGISEQTFYRCRKIRDAASDNSLYT